MSQPLQLNLTEIIKSRAGSKGKFIPRWLLRGLERIIHQDELNEMLRVSHPAEGSDFSKRIVEHLDLTVDVEGLDNLPDDKPYVFASNHPLGGLDGVALVGVLGSRFGDENVRVMVNDLLMNVKPLAGVFLPINKYGSKGARKSSILLNESMEAGRHIVMFPAGLVSRLQPSSKSRDKTCHGSSESDTVDVSRDTAYRVSKNKIIRDLAWKKSFVSKALEFNREIIPVKFEGLNSMRFYKTARWRKKLGLKINIEQALLPGEVCRSRGKHFTIKFGTPVDPAALKASGLTLNQIVERIYSAVYSL